MSKINKQELQTIIAENLMHDEEFQQLLNEGRASAIYDFAKRAGGDLWDWVRGRPRKGAPFIPLPKPIPPRYGGAPGSELTHGGVHATPGHGRGIHDTRGGGAGEIPHQPAPGTVPPHRSVAAEGPSLHDPSLPPYGSGQSGAWGAGPQLPKLQTNLPILRRGASQVDILANQAARRMAQDFKNNMGINPAFQEFVLHFRNSDDQLDFYMRNNHYDWAQRRVRELAQTEEARKLFPDLDLTPRGPVIRQTAQKTASETPQSAVKQGAAATRAAVHADDAVGSSVTINMPEPKKSMWPWLAGLSLGYGYLDSKTCPKDETGECIPGMPRGGPFTQHVVDPVMKWLGWEPTKWGTCDDGAGGTYPCLADAIPGDVIDPITHTKSVGQQNIAQSADERKAAAERAERARLNKLWIKTFEDADQQQESFIRDTLKDILLAEQDIPDLEDVEDAPSPSPPTPSPAIAAPPAEVNPPPAPAIKPPPITTTTGKIDLDETSEASIEEGEEYVKSYQGKMFEEKFNKLREAFAKQ